MNDPDKVLESLLEPYRKMAIFEDFELTSPESPGMGGDTPLHVAAFDNDVEALRVLMPFVGNIDVRGELRFTPLHSAILHGSVDSSAYLISLGADLHCANDLEESALEMMRGKPEFSGLLRSVDGGCSG